MKNKAQHWTLRMAMDTKKWIVSLEARSNSVVSMTILYLLMLSVRYIGNLKIKEPVREQSQNKERTKDKRKQFKALKC